VVINVPAGDDILLLLFLLLLLMLLLIKRCWNSRWLLWQPQLAAPWCTVAASYCRISLASGYNFTRFNTKIVGHTVRKVW